MIELFIKTIKIYIMNQFALKMMLLIGMKTNLIKYPTAPMTANPIAQDVAILMYST